MKAILKLFTFALLLATSSFAQDQQEMNRQAERDAARADKALNEVYKKLLATQDAEGAKLLKESQRAWIAFRDAEAKFASDEARGGSMAPLLYFGSLARITQERVKNLKEHLGDAEPDPKPEAPASTQGAKSQHLAALSFFEAYRDHNRKAAQKVAEEQALNKLVWDSSSGDNTTLKLMDDSHIYYEGGSIQLKFQKTRDGKWLVSDVSMTAD